MCWLLLLLLWSLLLGSMVMVLGLGGLAAGFPPPALFLACWLPLAAAEAGGKIELGAGVGEDRGEGEAALAATSLAYFWGVLLGVLLLGFLFWFGIWVWDGVKEVDLSTRPVSVVWRVRCGVEGGSSLGSAGWLCQFGGFEAAE